MFSCRPRSLLRLALPLASGLRFHQATRHQRLGPGAFYAQTTTSSRTKRPALQLLSPAVGSRPVP